MNNFWKAALIRALRTFCQTLISTLPAGLTITPVMIKEANWTILYTIAAWLMTAFIAALTSLITSVATGLPEVEG
jgi:hypothetical protein